jgi:hypothetical protein
MTPYGVIRHTPPAARSPVPAYTTPCPPARTTHPTTGLTTGEPARGVVITTPAIAPARPHQRRSAISVVSRPVLLGRPMWCWDNYASVGPSSGMDPRWSALQGRHRIIRPSGSRFTRASSGSEPDRTWRPVVRREWLIRLMRQAVGGAASPGRRRCPTARWWRSHRSRGWRG